MTYEEQVEAAAKALYESDVAGTDNCWARTSDRMQEVYYRRAEVVLKAVGIESPKPPWPTDEMLASFRATYNAHLGPLVGTGDSVLRECLRVVEVNNPIVQAAIELRDKAEGRDAGFEITVSHRTNAVIDAVNEAGL